MAENLKALLKLFRPIAAQPKLAADPKTRRRETFAKAVKEQLALCENPKLTRAIKVKGEARDQKIRAWWYQTADGDFALAPKFGVRGIELAPGMTAIKIGKIEEVKRALEGLAAAAQAGELDQAFQAAQPKPPKAKGGK